MEYDEEAGDRDEQHRERDLHDHEAAGEPHAYAPARRAPHVLLQPEAVSTSVVRRDGTMANSTLHVAATTP